MRTFRLIAWMVACFTVAAIVSPLSFADYWRIGRDGTPLDFLATLLAIGLFWASERILDKRRDKETP